MVQEKNRVWASHQSKLPRRRSLRHLTTHKGTCETRLPLSGSASLCVPVAAGYSLDSSNPGEIPIITLFSRRFSNLQLTLKYGWRHRTNQTILILGEIWVKAIVRLPKSSPGTVVQGKNRVRASNQAKFPRTFAASPNNTQGHPWDLAFRWAAAHHHAFRWL